MASILDQYENAQASYISPSTKRVQEPLGPGFIDVRLPDSELPIFCKKKINFKPEDSITHLVVCNNFLVLAMKHGVLMRLDLEHAEDTDKVELFKPGEERIHKLFLDPTGRHVIISLESMENSYLSRNSKKPKPITKLKGHHIDSVGWNWQNEQENTTGSILLGTSKGLIFETEISTNEESRFWQGNLDQYLKQLFNLRGPSAESITGIEFDRMPSDSMTEYHYYILVSTPGKLYQFVGSVSKTAELPMFQQLFQQYEEGNKVQFQEFPGDFGYSELRLYMAKNRGPAKKFAWMAGPGVVYGDIDIMGRQRPDTVLCNQMHMRYPQEPDQKAETKPFGMALTEFHVLLLFGNKLKAFCLLNEQMIYDEQYPDDLLGIWRDPSKGTIWVYTLKNVFKYKVTLEARDVWQMYLDKKEFELAKQYCGENPVQLDKVLTKQAEFLFNDRRYQKSAEMYAQTQNSFEEVALKFIRLDDKDALRTLLHKKLEALRPQDKTQMTMLVTWLIEIYLNQLGELKEQQVKPSQRYRDVQQEFQVFLKQTRVKDCVMHNKHVVYDLISSHGDIVDFIFFALLMEDFEKVISHYIQYDDYKSALDILTKQPETSLYYKFSPLLIQYIPKETVTAWISAEGPNKHLDPKQLIPALVQYDHRKYLQQGSEVIRYLEFCIRTQKNRDQAIHNYLLSLYAKLQPDKLMGYLLDQDQEAQSEDELCYDLKYALRLCSEHGHKRECVHIYSRMNLYEEAVDLALTVDVELAKTEANKPEEDVELKKKLWLRIARHVVEEEKDVKRAMEFLHECDLLKIEDILPFFPDFVTIDHFKDAIVTSLQKYNQHIDTLKVEMEEATDSAEEIRKEIQAFRNKYAHVKALDKCSKCGFPLMTRAFYLFPCQHKFHSDCLIEEILPNLTGKMGARVKELQKKLAEREESRQPAAVLGKQDMAALSTKMSAKAELDDLVASECIYCGIYMIRSIDKPFIEDNEDDKGWV
ncbi:vacuolar protein sorting-associated protein 18 homolog [Dreissena polymorpha]|uniref:vacuolar protein sorting-associated protein 18 homolog n=1 Tax=Dreissena polymorpha TaxID=45954 RepID=UPI002264BCE0|nr:vacuolar protein sorting-associated protein 18 homolog [Dreissena polymorpha]